MSEPEKRLTPPERTMGEKAARIRLLRVAGEYVGHEVLARSLGIQERSLRAKLTADRGIEDSDLRIAADAIEAKASAMMAHAAQMRERIA